MADTAHVDLIFEKIFLKGKQKGNYWKLNKI